jgi:uncharacterized surface protein with fasciclin (FAS1) repeats
MDVSRSWLLPFKTAGLVDTLKGQGPFTVFAPPTRHSKSCPAGTVENLLKPENKAQLTKVLTYHVVPGKVMSRDISGNSPRRGSASAVRAQTTRFPRTDPLGNVRSAQDEMDET